jgi:hypothetical protein
LDRQVTLDGGSSTDVDGVAAKVEGLGDAAPAEVVDGGSVDDHGELPHGVIDKEPDVDAAGSPRKHSYAVDDPGGDRVDDADLDVDGAPPQGVEDEVVGDGQVGGELRRVLGRVALVTGDSAQGLGALGPH